MNQEVLTSAISASLSSLETFTTSSILLAIAIIWPAIRGHDTIEAMGIKIKREYAFHVVGLVYSFFAAAMLIIFVRLCFLTTYISGVDNPVVVMETIFTHSWILNPYAYFGSGFLSILFSSTTFGLLIVVWWFLYSSLRFLSKEQSDKIKKLSLVEKSFLFIGLAAMSAMILAGILMREISLNAKIEGLDSWVFMGKYIMLFVSTLIGFIIYKVLGRPRKLWMGNLNLTIFLLFNLRVTCLYVRTERRPASVS